MSEALPPLVATLVADANQFLSGMAKSSGASVDFAKQVEKADIATKKAALSAQAWGEKAAAASAAAAEAARAAATGAASQEEAEAAAAKAASVNERAQLAARDAQLAAARQAEAAAAESKAAASVQEASAARTAAAWDKAGKTSALIGLAVGVVSVKMAADFQQSTNVLVTAAGEQQSNLGKTRDGILAIAGSTGTAWQQVTEAMYDAEKAGFSYAKGGLDVVQAAAEGAREENASLATVTAGLTTTLHNYGLTSADAVRVTNALKTGAGEAKTTFEGFTSGLGAFESRAAAAKIGLADVLGVYASITQQGISAQQASQNLGSTIQNLSKPLGPAVALMGQLGISSVDVATKLGDGPGGRGLAGTLNYLSDTILNHMGPAGTVLLNTFNTSKTATAAANTELSAMPAAAQKLAQGFVDGSVSIAQFRTQSRALPGELGTLAQQWYNTYTQAHGFQNALKAGGPLATTYLADLRGLTGGQQGLTVALAAAGVNFDATQERSAKIAASYNSNSKAVQGWASTQKLFNTQLGEFKQQAEAVGIRLGTDLLPPLKSILGVLAEHPAVLKDVALGVLALGAAWTAVKVESIVDGIIGMTTRLGVAAAGWLGIGTAATTAAAEVTAADAEMAAAGAGAAGAGAAEAAAAAGAGASEGAAAAGAAGASKFSAAKLIVPVAITYVAIKGLGLEQAVKDILKGDLAAATKDSPGWVKSLAGDSGNLSGTAQGLLADKPLYDFKQQAADINKQITTLNGQMDDLFLQGKFGSPGFIALGKQIDADKAKLADLTKTANQTSYLQGMSEASQAQKAAAAKTAPANTDPNFTPPGDRSGLFADVEAAAAIKDVKAYQAGLKDLGSQIDSTSKSLTGSSNAAEGNRQAITDLVTKTEAAARATALATGKSSDYEKIMGMSIPQIEAVATANGLNRAQVDQLIASLGAMPPEKSVQITTPGADAARVALQGLAASVAYLQANRTVDIQVQTYGSATPAAIANAVNSQSGGHHAAGGYISGAGTGTSDSISARLSNGEFVVKAAAAKKNLGLLHAINNSYADGGPVGFASGGSVPQLNAAEIKFLQGYKAEKAAAKAPPKLNKAEIAYLEGLNLKAHMTPATSAFLHDMAYMGALTSRQDTITAYTAAQYAAGKTTAADVPRMQATAQAATTQYDQAQAYFNAHQHALVATFTSKTATAAQRTQARSVYDELQSNASRLKNDAHAENLLAQQMRSKYAGGEYQSLVPGRASSDLSYLAVGHSAAATAQAPIHITVVSQLDGKPIAQSTATIFHKASTRSGINVLQPVTGFRPK